MYIAIYSQRDQRWASTKLGNSATVTIGTDGCLLSDFAMLADVTPAVMNEARKATGGFQAEPRGAYAANFDIAAACARIGAKDVRLVGSASPFPKPVPAANMTTLINHLRSGNCAILEVDGIPGGQLDTHFVIALGASVDGQIVIVDPWTGDLAPLCPRYGPTAAIAIYGYWLYVVGATTPLPDEYVAEISASTSHITAGETVKLNLNFERVDGAWLISGSAISALDGSKLPVVMTVAPQQTTTFKLRVLVKGATIEKSVTVTVDPAPPPVTPTARKVGLGLHVLANRRAWELGYSKGARVVTFMNDQDGACMYADCDPAKWTPDSGKCLSIYRQYHDTNPWSAQQMVDQLGGLTGNPNPQKYNVIITLANEWDNDIPGAGTTEDATRKFCRWSLECLDKLNAKGFYNVALLTSSTGTPDFTNDGVCKAIREELAPAINSGRVRYIDMHNYSPDMQHIYDDSGLIWYERRWEFLYTKCGVNPTAPVSIISSETGVDEGGHGGFPAHQCSRDDVNRWCTRFIEVQLRPLIVNGVSYRSPFLAGTVFQSGDDGTDKGHWGGYNVEGYLPLVWKL